MTKILVVSDLHVGSIYGLMPAVVEEESSAGGDENYIIHKPNRFQRSILKRWKEMVKKVGKVDVMVVNGDSVDGVNYKERGKSAWTTNLSTQVDAAADLVSMVDYDNLVVTQGSLYHVDSNISTDYALAKMLEGKFGDDYVVKTKEGARFHFAHQVGVSSSSWQYRSTPIARELVAAVLHEDVFGKYHGIIRCLSDDTEILTRRGWLGHDSISVGESVLTLSKSNRAMEWCPVLAKTQNRDYPELLHLTSKGINMLVTPDHNILTVSRKRGKIMSHSADDFAQMYHKKIPVSGHIDAKGLSFPDAYVELAGWIISEGSFYANNASKGYDKVNTVRISQSWPNREEVEDVLRRTRIPYTVKRRKMAGTRFEDPRTGKEYRTKHDMAVFYIRQPHGRRLVSRFRGEKRIPPEFMEMNNHQFDLFLGALMAGDGSWDRRGHSGKYFTADRVLADQFQALCVMHGYKTSCRLRGGDIPNYVIHLSRKIDVNLESGFRAERVPYSGRTWCVTTKNGTIVTRRKGDIAILGNSHAHYFVMVNFGTAFGMITPGWQGRSPFVARRSLAYAPKLGWVLLDVDKDKTVHKSWTTWDVKNPVKELKL